MSLYDLLAGGGGGVVNAVNTREMWLSKLSIIGLRKTESLSIFHTQASTYVVILPHARTL